jgi:hypothetical protein
MGLAVGNAGKHDPNGGELVDHLSQAFAVKFATVCMHTADHLAKAV